MTKGLILHSDLVSVLTVFFVKAYDEEKYEYQCYKTAEKDAYNGTNAERAEIEKADD